MESTPCDIYEYNSDEYNDCIKDIVYEAAQDEWIMLDPRFPNLKGVTPERIDDFLEDVYRFYDKSKRDYYEDYLQHVMVYDRDDIIIMCKLLGEQIEEKYPGKLHSDHSIFVTTPRGGYEVLSIFAYTNNLSKYQIPSHIRKISEEEYEDDIKLRNFYIETKAKHEGIEKLNKSIDHYKKNNYPIIPDVWLNIDTSYNFHKIETVFIIDDIIASGMQIIEACSKIDNFFKNKVDIIPVILAKRKDVKKGRPLSAHIFDKTLYVDETVGIEKWNKAQSFIEDQRMGYITPKSELIKDFNELITVRFPWGSPDGESDAILTSLYEGRRGLKRIEKKRRVCKLTPDKCELK